MSEESLLKKPYLDPSLRGSAKKYAQFLAVLRRAGIIEFVNSHGICEVGAFAVRKEDKRQRLVLDARIANLYFAAPPRTSLPSGASLSAIRVDREVGLFFSGLDLREYFYHLRLPEELRGYFHLPPASAGMLQQEGLCKEFPRSQTLFPRLIVVPMGWTHALDLAQHYFDDIVCKALSLRRSSLLHDGDPPSSAEAGVAAVYVDNFIYCCNSPKKAAWAFKRVQQ